MYQGYKEYTMLPMLFETGVGNETHFPEAGMSLQCPHFESASLFDTKCHLMVNLDYCSMRKDQLLRSAQGQMESEMAFQKRDF